MDATAYLDGRPVGVLLKHNDADFAFMVINGGRALGVNPAAVESRGGEIVGNNRIFFPNGLLGVNKLSQKKELVRLFVLFRYTKPLYQPQKLPDCRTVYLPRFCNYLRCIIIVKDFKQIHIGLVFRRNTPFPLRILNQCLQGGI